MLFIVHEHMNTILLAKTFNEIVFVFINPFDQITRYANVESTIFPTSQYIYIVLFHIILIGFPLSRE